METLTENLHKSSNTVWHQPTVTRDRREHQNGHRSTIIWFTGLSGSGKSTLAHAVEEELHQLGCKTFVFDGDNVRHGLCGDLGFSEEDRTENIRRVGQMAKLFIESGVIALTAFISPFQVDRQRVRMMVEQDSDFLEIYCKCPLEVCEERDVKGLYQRARKGEIADFTGISSPYEEPENADLIINTSELEIQECVDKVTDMLESKGLISTGRGC
jgi:adenylylsulfate kinase